MQPGFLIYGANGFVGAAIARMAAQQGLRPILAGRSAAAVEQLAGELGLEHRIVGLGDAAALDRALREVRVVLHCAGPFIYTSAPLVEACLRAGAHYLDLTGELPVYQAVAARDAAAKAQGVMLLPGAGFDVVPTDCLALHLKQRLPSATRLALAFAIQGPAGAPPGTQRTIIEMARYGSLVRRNGQLVSAGRATQTRTVDFGAGPVQVTRLSWGDIFMAYYSTGIPNIEDYALLPTASRWQMAALAALSPLLRSAAIRTFAQRWVRPGSTADERASTRAHVWGEVQDDQGRRAVARLHGPEAGVVWTGRAALAAVRRALAGDAPAGFQTPARAYGADFALEAEGVAREDLI